jgi:hypothetical protein
MPHSCIDVIGRESGTLRDGLWISIFNTSLADKPNYLTNKLARNHRQGGGAESSKTDRAEDTEEDTQTRTCHPIFKGFGGGGNKDCGVLYSTVVVPNKLTDLLVVNHEAGNLENTTTMARGLVDEVLGSVGGWRERLQGLFVPR